jgi:hypothetical protein
MTVPVLIVALMPLLSVLADRSMPCGWTTGSISRTSSRTAERLWALRSLAKSTRFDTLSVKRILHGSLPRPEVWLPFHNPQFDIGVKCLRLAFLRRSANRKLAQQQQNGIRERYYWNYASSPQARPSRQARLFKLLSEGGKFRLQIGNLAA